MNNAFGDALSIKATQFLKGIDILEENGTSCTCRLTVLVVASSMPCLASEEWSWATTAHCFTIADQHGRNNQHDNGAVLHAYESRRQVHGDRIKSVEKLGEAEDE